MKKQTSILIMLMMVSAIGISLPSAFSIGSGQHQFIQIDPANPDAFCTKCHSGSGDTISAELMSSGKGIYNGGVRIHSMVKCVDCHQLENGYGTSRGSEKTSHAAIIPTCIKCHYTELEYNVTKELSSPKEAHNKFNDDTACIGCHTSIAVTGSISYTYSGKKTISGLTIGK